MLVKIIFGYSNDIRFENETGGDPAVSEETKEDKKIEKKSTFEFTDIEKNFPIAESNFTQIGGLRYTQEEYAQSEKHRRARRFSKPKQTDSDTIERCECCGYPIENEQFPLTASLTDIFDSSPTFAQYFFYIKNFIYFMIAFSAICGMPNMILNYMGNHCEIDHEDNPYSCYEGDLFTILSLGNILNKDSYQLYNIQKFLNFLAVIALTVGILIIQRNQYKFYLENTHRKAHPSDYAVHISGIPTDRPIKGLDLEIRKLFANSPYEVRRVIIAYDMREPIELYESLYKLMTQEKAEKNEKRKAALEKKIIHLREEIEVLKKENVFTKVTGDAFVMFQFPHHAQQVYHTYKRTWVTRLLEFFNKTKSKPLMFEDVRLRVRRAPDPTDISWENLSVGFRERLLRGLMTNFLAILILIANTAMVLWFLNLLKSLREDEERREELRGNRLIDLDKVLLFLLPLVVKIFHLIIPYFLHKLLKLHKQKSYSDFCEQVVFFETFYDVLNELLANLLYCLHFNDFFGEYGLIAFAADILFVTLIYDVLDHIFDIKGWKRVVRRFYSMRIKKRKLTQNELNRKYEMPRPDISERYANVIYKTYMAAFYMPILPIASFLIAASLYFDYLLEKIVFLRKRSFSRELNGDFPVRMFKIVRGALVLYAVSGVIFDYLLIGNNPMFHEKSLTGFCLASVIISLLSLMIPSHWILKNVMLRGYTKDGLINLKTYDEQSKDALFHCRDYDADNPLNKLKKMADIVGISAPKRPAGEMLQGLFKYTLAKKKSLSGNPSYGSGGLINWTSARSKKLAYQGITSLLGQKLGMSLSLEVEEPEQPKKDYKKVANSILTSMLAGKKNT